MKTIFAYSAEGLEQLVVDLGQPKFRAKQLIGWLYGHGVTSYDQMANVPKALREALAEEAPLVVPTVVDKQVSADGTRKYLLELQDGALVETVAIPSRSTREDGLPKRLTVCFSTQVGCSMQCAFCATGTEGFSRNLYPGEMVWQLLICAQDMGMRVSNAVGMGQGEPFLNYDNVLAALRFMNRSDCLEIGARHISISTCGIIEGIDRLAQEPEQFTLALSLHSAQQEVRNVMMPRCASMPLSQVKPALQRYINATNRRVSLEYLLIAGETDTNEALEALVAFCDGLLAHVNLLTVNEVEGSPYRRSSVERIREFERTLSKVGVETTVRDSRGADIDGACGQLKNRRA